MGNMKCRPVEEMSERSIANFWSHVNKDGQIRSELLGPCWEWTASLFDEGYGQFKGGPSTRAHRVAYELMVGPCPPELEPDHLCEFRACVNPSHLEWVTHGENLRRKYGREAERTW
jgi:hypothetical protein